MSRITEFKCKNCGQIFNRSETIQKLDEFKDPQGNIKYTKVLGCPNCPSRNLEIESMGDLDAEE